MLYLLLHVHKSAWSKAHIFGALLVPYCPPLLLGLSTAVVAVWKVTSYYSQKFSALVGAGETVKNPFSQSPPMATEQTILVGKKPTTNYVIATVMAFNSGVKRVILKARGTAIARAVSTAVMVRDRFLPGKVQIKDVKLLSDKVQGQGGRERTVAAVEIVLEMA